VKYYPVFVRLEGEKAVIVGGGKVAERKALALIKANATVYVISPTITKNLQRYRDKGWIRHIKRGYRRGDLKNAFIVVAATPSKDVNSRVEREARGLSRLINVVDTPSEGNFIVPSTVRRGPLTIAISTEGQSPAISKAIRKELESLYGPAFARYLRFAGNIRKEALKRIEDKKDRERFIKFLASKEVLRTLRSKSFTEACRMVHNYQKNIKKRTH